MIWSQIVIFWYFYIFNGTQIILCEVKLKVLLVFYCQNTLMMKLSFPTTHQSLSDESLLLGSNPQTKDLSSKSRDMNTTVII